MEIPRIDGKPKPTADRIVLAEQLCANYHTIQGAYYEPWRTTPEQIEQVFAAMFKRMNPWCGVCGTRLMKYRHTGTMHRTMQEAVPDVVDRVREEGKLYKEKGGKY
jgi:hypothetical protein